MRQLRLVILAGIGILALCGVVVVTSLMDYVNHPGVAVAHVPPIVAPIAADTSDSAQQAAPAPLPSTPVTAVPANQPPPAFPPADAGQQPPQQQSSTTASREDALSRLIQQLQQQRKRRPVPPPP